MTMAEIKSAMDVMRYLEGNGEAGLGASELLMTHKDWIGRRVGTKSSEP
jgi:hypothetical protein